MTSNTQNIGTYVIRTNISDHFSVLLSRQVNKKENPLKLHETNKQQKYLLIQGESS